MSIRLMSQVWDHYHGPAGRKLVLLCLADFASDEGLAWPSAATIARKSDMGLSTVRRHLARLTRDALIHRRGRSSNDYSASQRYLVTPPSQSGATPVPNRDHPPRPKSGPPQSQVEHPPGPKLGPNPPGAIRHMNRGSEAGPDSPPAADDQTASDAPAPPPISEWEKKRQRAKLEGALFKALARLGVAVTSPADREAWKGLLMKVRPKNPDEAAGIIGACIELFRDSTGRELRWPSEARTWIERAANHHRRESA